MRHDLLARLQGTSSAASEPPTSRSRRVGLQSHVSPETDEPEGLKLEWQRRLPIALSVIIGAVVLVVALVDFGGAGPRRPPRTAQTGLMAPAFSLGSLDGKSVELGDYAGSPVIVNFWASWCLPCTEDFPELAATLDRYESSGLEVLGIVHNDEERFARDFGAENGATWPLLMDPGNTTWEAYSVIGLPTSYFIDSAGLLQAVAFGPLDETAINEHLSAVGIEA